MHNYSYIHNYSTIHNIIEVLSAVDFCKSCLYSVVVESCASIVTSIALVFSA